MALHILCEPPAGYRAISLRYRTISVRNRTICEEAKETTGLSRDLCTIAVRSSYSLSTGPNSKGLYKKSHDARTYVVARRHLRCPQNRTINRK